MSSISAILFVFILFFAHQSLGYDGEQHLENEHDSPNSHSESHEEGSGIRSYFKKHRDYPNGKTLTKITNTRPSIQKRVVEQ